MSGKRQFGALRRLPSGRWQARYRAPSGEMVAAPVTFVTKGDASRWLATVEADIVRGHYIDPRSGRITFDEWANQWLARPGKRATSIARDRHALEVWRRAIGTRPLASITPMHIQAAVDARARLAAPATVARDFSTLRAVLNAALDAEIIGRSPARKAVLPRVRPPEKAPLTPVELLDVAGDVPDRYRVLVLVGGVLGLRWGEAIGLRVRDIDFLRRSVTVAQTVEEVAGNLTLVAQAKSEAGLRSMTVPTFLTDELARHLAEHRPGAAGDDLVFVGPRGGILRRRFGERILRPAVARSGLPASLTFHGLRHAAITALAEEEVYPRTMQQRAGHASARLTLERYTRVTDAADRGAAEALERRFREAISGGTGTDVARGPSKSPSTGA
jgi:integrase